MRSGRGRSCGAVGVNIEDSIPTAVTAAAGLPLNVMVGPGSPRADDLAEAGMRRISQDANAFLALGGNVEVADRAAPRRPPRTTARPVRAGLAVLPGLVG